MINHKQKKSSKVEKTTSEETEKWNNLLKQNLINLGIASFALIVSIFTVLIILISN
ncbi:hypothetical protein ACTHAL_003556 [Priestia flexa]|jgi:hypothetical protein|uniref:hypothetical protein n=1 Tax=Bacillaceae TaxID=186817 RepID=UPI00081569C3|nr:MULTISPECIES: hypothetical protein [Bacillaceae]SCC03500.1 hypothetical protein GA0061087_100875 [Priestia flexa]